MKTSSKIAIAAAAFGAWWLMKKKKNEPVVNPNETTEPLISIIDYIIDKGIRDNDKHYLIVHYKNGVQTNFYLNSKQYAEYLDVFAGYGIPIKTE